MREEKSDLASKIYPFKAEFYDVDSMCVLWHGNYVKYAESARCRLLDDIGFNYNNMRENGFAMPIIKMEFKFIAPILFNEDFRIRIDLLEFENILRFQYIFLDSNNKKRTIAQTSQVALNIENMEILYPMPQIFQTKIINFMQNAKGQ